MSNENFLERIASQLGQSASVKNVYGEPIKAGDKTIIPVAQVAYGFGGGYGHGNKKHKKHHHTNTDDKDAPQGEGAGGGGGVYAKPKGIYEITPKSTRFIAASNTGSLLIGFGIGFLIKTFFFTKKNKYKNQ